MTRPISLASVLFIAALWVPASAQTPASSGTVANDKAAANRTALPTNEAGGRTLADYVQDSSTEPVEMTVAGIEKILKETHVITVRFNGHQVSLPVVSHLDPAKIAERILDQAKYIRGVQLYAGKTGLLISTESNLASTMAFLLAKVMFVEPGERKEVTNFPVDSTILAPDGLPVTQLGPGDLLKQGLLDKAESISVMLGTYNIVLPLSDKSPRRALADALEKLREGRHSYSFLDGRKSLSVMTGVEGLEPLLTSFIGILNAAGDPPKVSDANAKAGGGISISVPAVGPEPIGLDFGGGGFGGFAPPLPAQAMPSKNYVMGKNIVIALSEKGDRAWGYSKKLGKWTTLKLDSPSEKAFPVLGDEVACVINAVRPSDEGKGRFVWGYSPSTGRWDKLTLPAGSKAQPIVQTDMILVEDGAYVQIFSAQSGKWAAPPKPDDGVVQNTDTPIGLPGPPNVNTPVDSAEKAEIKVFALTNLPADDAATLVRQLFRHGQLSVAADGRTNSLLAQGTAEVLMQIEAVLMRLDEAKPANGKRTDSQALDLKSAEQASGRVTQLKQLYAAQEQKAAELAQQIRNAPQPSNQLKSSLRQAVTDAFALRQQLHQAELAAFQQRMAKVQQTIRTRDQLKEQIIDRRVEDLISPDLKWDEPGQARSAVSQGPTEIDGEWQLQSIKGGGVISHEENLKLRIQDHQYVILRGENASPYSVILDSSTNPKSIDLIAERPNGRPSMTSRGIYQRNGDILMISWGPDPKVRPLGFDEDKAAVHTWQRIEQEDAPKVQVRITEPAGATITLLDQTKHSVPVGVWLQFPAGKVFRLRLSGIPSRGNFEPVVTLDIPLPVETTNSFLNLNVIPIKFTDEDLSQAAAGNTVIKAIYLKDPVAGDLASAGPRSLEVMASTRTDPGVDVVAEADKRGTIVAVVRILPHASEPQTPVVQGEDLRPFEVPKGLTSFVVGVVQEVRENNTVVISLLEPGSAKLKDEWVIDRKDPGNSEGGTSFAKVEVVEILKDKAVARIIESTRVQDNNTFAWQAVRVGDMVTRPNFVEADKVGKRETVPGQSTLDELRSFQNRLAQAKSAVERTGEDLKLARQAFLNKTGTRQTADAAEKKFRDSEQELQQVRSMFDARLKVHEIAVKLAEKSREVAMIEYQKALSSNQLQPGTVTNTDLKRLKLAWESATLSVEQASILYELYQKSAPTQTPPETTSATEGIDSAVPAAPQVSNEDRIWKTLGLRLVQAAPSAIHQANSLYNGGLNVLAVRPDSPAAVDGKLQQGDILCGLHVWRTETIDHVMFVLDHHDFPVFQPLKFFVLRDGKTLSGHMKIGASALPPSELVSPPDPIEQSQKNLSDLMLALHHYHDQHKHFPPAVMMGKDGKGKVPHSWRVEILPQLGEQKLYDEYHFDEPWNSEHNLKLVARMPAVFRSPLDRPDSYNTSYFGLVTPGLKPQASASAAGASGTEDLPKVLRYDLGTVFSNPQGTQLLDIHDGTAVTVALVESKRAIAWTQPEDVSYSADQPVPLLGGWYTDGWNAAFAEGTVKMISNQNPDATLRAIFTIGGGENVKPRVVEDPSEEGGTVPPASKDQKQSQRHMRKQWRLARISV